MNIQKQQVNMLYLTELINLDPIRVIFLDQEVGAGRVIIQCYDKAWAVYWGSMGNYTIKEFFLVVGIDYIINKIDPHAYDERLDYLIRIVTAIREALRKEQG